MAETLARAGMFEGAAFHAQQGAEKALKALLLAKGSLWPRTPSSIALIEVLRHAGVSVPSELDTLARKLDAHYIESRYPNAAGCPPERFYDKTIAAEAIQAQAAILSFVEANLAG